MKVIILVSMLVAGIAAVPVQEPKARFDNYRVYRFVPKNEADLEVLSNLENTFPGINYWQRPAHVGMGVDVMVPPHLEAEIITGLSATMDVPEPFIQNVQQLIDEEEANHILSKLKSSPGINFDWIDYHSYADIIAFIEEQARNHSSVASIESYGTSFENRDLKLIKIGNGQRPIIFIDANIHAREWITNAVATYIINELLNGPADGIKSLLNTYDFHIAPCINPDGYEYSRNTNRMWRKTRSNLAGGVCRGADPNRNFAFQWNTGGSSSVCTSDTYMGVRAFSEPETQALADYYDTIASRTRAYVSLHSYSQLVLIPYGTNVNGRPHVPDHNNHMRVGGLMETAIAGKFGTRYTTGNIVDILYVASGASVDWVKGVHNTTLAYTLELRDTGRYGFILPPDQIIPSAQELIDGLVAMANDLRTQL